MGDAEAKGARAELRRLKAIAKHAKALFDDGQLDKHPSSDTCAEYKLWKLLKPKK